MGTAHNFDAFSSHFLFPHLLYAKTIDNRVPIVYKNSINTNKQEDFS